MQTYNKPNGTTHVLFSDIAEASSLALEGVTQMTGSAERKRCNYWLSADDWTGRRFGSWMACNQAVSQVWEEGLARINELAEQLESQQELEIKTRKRKRRWSEEDGDINADRFLAGADDFYEEHSRQATHGPAAITLICNTSCASRVTPEQAAWRGALCVVLAEFFEAAGYPTEVYCYHAFRGLYRSSTEYRDMIFTYPVKECGETIERNTLANATSCWFFRTLGLAVACMNHKQADRNSHVDDCHGFPMYDLQKTVSGDMAFAGDLVLEIPQVWNHRDAVAAMNGLLAQLAAY